MRDLSKFIDNKIKRLEILNSFKANEISQNEAISKIIATMVNEPETTFLFFVNWVKQNFENGRIFGGSGSFYTALGDLDEFDSLENEFNESYEECVSKCKVEAKKRGINLWSYNK